MPLTEGEKAWIQNRLDGIAAVAQARAAALAMLNLLLTLAENPLFDPTPAQKQACVNAWAGQRAAMVAAANALPQ